MTDNSQLNRDRDSSKANAAHRSELETRADEIRGIAAKRTCKNINDLAHELGWNMETARHANQVLALNLPDAKLRAGPPTAGQANPKQPKKQAGK